jgi:hypothetical protein
MFHSPTIALLHNHMFDCCRLALQLLPRKDLCIPSQPVVGGAVGPGEARTCAQGHLDGEVASVLWAHNQRV